MTASKTRNAELAHHPALRQYLELIREIPEVAEVRLSATNELYAIIAADTPDAAVSYQVYRAEGKVMDAVRSHPFRFRLVNRRQLPPKGRAAQIRSLGELVWRRP